MIGGYDYEHGTNIAGHRGYFLTDIGVALNQAFINYALRFLRKRSYKLLQTPFMMNKAVMSKVAQLSQFDEELYKVCSWFHMEMFLWVIYAMMIQAFVLYSVL